VPPPGPMSPSLQTPPSAQLGFTGAIVGFGAGATVGFGAGGAGATVGFGTGAGIIGGAGAGAGATVDLGTTVCGLSVSIAL
jgi:hypothetical protein